MVFFCCWLVAALESLRFRGRFRLVVQHGGALRNVSFGSGLIEAARAMWTLHVVRVLRGGWRRQIRQFASLRQVGLHFLGRSDGLNELLVLSAPVTLAAIVRAFWSSRRSGNGLLTGRSADLLLLEHVLFGVGSQHSVLCCIKDLAFLALGLLANLSMFLDSVFGEVPATDGAPNQTVRNGFV